MFWTNLVASQRLGLCSVCVCVCVRARVCVCVCVSCTSAAEEVCAALNETVPASVSAVKKSRQEGNRVVIVTDMIAVCLRVG